MGLFWGHIFVRFALFMFLIYFLLKDNFLKNFVVFCQTSTWVLFVIHSKSFFPVDVHTDSWYSWIKIYPAPAISYLLLLLFVPTFIFYFFLPSVLLFPLFLWFHILCFLFCLYFSLCFPNNFFFLMSVSSCPGVCNVYSQVIQVHFQIILYHFTCNVSTL